MKRFTQTLVNVPNLPTYGDDMVCIEWSSIRAEKAVPPSFHMRVFDATPGVGNTFCEAWPSRTPAEIHGLCSRGGRAQGQPNAAE